MHKEHSFIDPELFSLIEQEGQRQQQEINLIASENYVSQEILASTGSILTNKYAEGYPSKRYYGGCQYVDTIEQLAIDRCKALFDAPHANVQPHAGSQANMAAYFATLNAGDTILGMSLAEGGHLTHGHSVNFSGKLFKAVQYKVHPETELLDYDEIERLAHEHKPKLIIAGASAYSRVIDFERLGAIAKSTGALFMADIAHIAGLIAAKVHPSPFPHADIVTSTTHKTLRGPRGGFIMCNNAALGEKIDKTIMPGMQGGPLMHVIAAKAIGFYQAAQPAFVVYQQQVIKNAKRMAQEFKTLGYRIVTGGTDNHLFIVDLRSKQITGKAAETLLNSVGLTVSRSCIPFDPEKPWLTSGIRIGTPAITTRGMQEQEAVAIVQLIDEAIRNRDNLQTLKKIREQVSRLCQLFDIPGNIIQTTVNNPAATL